MHYKATDYTFWGLFNNGEQVDTAISTLAYIIGLVDSPENAIADLKKAKYVLRYQFDIEEQIHSAEELLSIQEKNFPKGFYPQTPVMLTIRWSPIAALLERGLNPTMLRRESDGMACASGIWEVQLIKDIVLSTRLETPEELFWHVLDRVIAKAKVRGHLLSIVAQPGWSYRSNVERPQNLTLEEAQKADRVIWQRTPRLRND